MNAAAVADIIAGLSAVEVGWLMVFAGFCLLGIVWAYRQ